MSASDAEKREESKNIMKKTPKNIKIQKQNTKKHQHQKIIKHKHILIIFFIDRERFSSIRYF